MSLKASLTVILCAGFLSPLAVAVNVRTDFGGLLDNSPFGGTANPTQVEKIPDSIEFRAVVDENTIQYFSIFDATTHRSVWLVLNSPVNEITARKYDPETMTIAVEYRGKSLHLPLKGAKKQSVRDGVEHAPESHAVAVESEFGDRPFRIGHVFEEVEIRRAVRQE